MPASQYRWVRRRSVVIDRLSITAPATARAQTSYPMTLRVDPIAVTRGQTVEITVCGPRELQRGVDSCSARGRACAERSSRSRRSSRPRPRPAAAAAAAGATAQVRARLEVAADAPLGPRELRVATPQGSRASAWSSSSTDPVVAEADDLANDRQRPDRPRS